MQDMDAVYRQHFRMVYQYLMSQTHQPDVAEELAQETFCQAVCSIHRYDGVCISESIRRQSTHSRICVSIAVFVTSLVR